MASQEDEDLVSKTRRALALLDGLRLRPQVEDWGSKLMFVSETLWQAIERGGLVGDAECERLIETLKDPDAFLLAGVMVPELRDRKEAEKVVHDRKRHILHRLNVTSEKTAAPPYTPGEAMYQAEKKALYEGDVYRTMLFLRRADKFTERQLKEIREWLDACPVKAGESEAEQANAPR